MFLFFIYTPVIIISLASKLSKLGTTNRPILLAIAILFPTVCPFGAVFALILFISSLEKYCFIIRVKTTT